MIPLARALPKAPQSPSGSTTETIKCSIPLAPCLSGVAWASQVPALSKAGGRCDCAEAVLSGQVDSQSCVAPLLCDSACVWIYAQHTHTHTHNCVGPSVSRDMGVGQPAARVHVVVSMTRLWPGVHCTFARQSVTGQCPVPSCRCPGSSARCGGVVEVGARVQFCQGGGSGSGAVLSVLAARWPRRRWAGAGPGPPSPGAA